MRAHDVVGPVMYDGENLLAQVHHQRLGAKKKEMQSHIDRLAAFPFSDLDDREFLDINARPATITKLHQNDKENDYNPVVSESLWAIEAGSDNEGGSGIDSWITDHDACSSSGDDGSYDSGTFFADSSDLWNDNIASDVSYWSENGTSQSSAESPSACGEWGDPINQSLDFESIAKRLKWKYPTAFSRSEKTVPHTEEEMGYYLEAADFLMDQAHRHRNQRLLRQCQAFRNMIRIRYSKEQSDTDTPVVDWDFVIQDLNTRMAQRKEHKKSNLSKEVQ
ncbi:H(+)-transporting V1 sector ATPase subunit F [Pestalotiopsis sp. IQ-011]